MQTAKAQTARTQTAQTPSTQPLVVLNVVGLTPSLLAHAPHLSALGEAKSWTSPLPAVTCTSQATMLTGLSPAQHGIVGNGWYYRDTQEIRFWQQARSLVQASSLECEFETAKMFWWFNQSSGAKYSVTPKPHYGCDGSKHFDIIDQTGCQLTERLGAFPFFSFWGPSAGLPSSRWIADASAAVIREKRPQLSLVYLPHLDYDFQRFPVQSPQRVAEVDQCAATVIDAAKQIGATVVAVSEYGLVPVSKPVHINRILRKLGWIQVRSGPFGETLLPGQCQAFAVADHQLAHIYVQDPSMIPQVKRELESVDGIGAVLNPGDVELDHPRSGELIALAAPDAWFTYYYWLDDRLAPDFARTVDIHRKPGYDPCELFLTSRVRAAARLAQKKLGLRYKMDVIPIDAALVRGSHGVHPDRDEDGPLIIGPNDGSGPLELPDDMRGFAAYARSLITGSHR